MQLSFSAGVAWGGDTGSITTNGDIMVGTGSWKARYHSFSFSRSAICPWPPAPLQGGLSLAASRATAQQSPFLLLMRATAVLALVFLLRLPGIAQGDTGFVSARRLNAVSLHSIVLLAFLRPKSPINDTTAVTGELYSTFNQWRPRLTSSDFDIVIMQTTTEDNASTLTGKFGPKSYVYVYVRDGKRQFVRVNDRKRLQQIEDWYFSFLAKPTNH